MHALYILSFTMHCMRMVISGSGRFLFNLEHMGKSSNNPCKKLYMFTQYYASSYIRKYVYRIFARSNA